MCPLADFGVEANRQAHLSGKARSCPEAPVRCRAPFAGAARPCRQRRSCVYLDRVIMVQPVSLRSRLFASWCAHACMPDTCAALVSPLSTATRALRPSADACACSRSIVAWSRPQQALALSRCQCHSDRATFRAGLELAALQYCEQRLCDWCGAVACPWRRCPAQVTR